METFIYSRVSHTIVLLKESESLTGPYVFILNITCAHLAINAKVRVKSTAQDWTYLYPNRPGRIRYHFALPRRGLNTIGPPKIG